MVALVGGRDPHAKRRDATVLLGPDVVKYMWGGGLKVARELLSAGADFNRATKSGSTPLKVKVTSVMPWGASRVRRGLIE